jgi:4-aminobutyrate aminotransferase/(S)-3-amino-2-methylpropionate transaminase
MDAPGPGGLGGTYGGNPVACAAGLAVLDVIEREGLCARAEAAGRRIAGFLTALAARPEGRPIGDVRALGAMCAFELVSDRAARTPDAALTKALCTRARELGLIVLSCGVHGNVVRILAPLTASDAVLDEGLSILATALAQTRENT